VRPGVIGLDLIKEDMDAVRASGITNRKTKTNTIVNRRKFEINALEFFRSKHTQKVKFRVNKKS